MLNKMKIVLVLATVNILLYTLSAFADSYTLGTEFQINTYTTYGQSRSAISSNGTNYMVTWQSDGQDGRDNGVYGQFIDLSGNLTGSEFQINTYTGSNQLLPAVASNGSDYMVTWISQVQDGSDYGIYGQMIDSSGNLTGSEFHINTYTTESQTYPSITSNGTDYLVAWISDGQDGNGYGVYGQMVDASGNLTGSEFRINTYTTNSQLYPSITSNGTDYLVTWASNGQDGNGYGVYGQMVDASGNLTGSEFCINTYTTNSQLYPSISSNGSEYMVTWASNEQDGNSYGVYGQMVDSSGNLTGSEFIINTYTTNSQTYPSLASNGSDYLVTWQSDGQDGNDYGVYGKLLTNDSPIPEPASMILLISGLGALIARRYRK